MRGGEPGLREIVTPEGRLILTDAAIAAVSAAAALRCPGVVALAGRRLQDELVDLLRDPREGGPWEAGAGGRGVEVDVDADRCAIALDVIVAFGSRLHTVGPAVIAAVGQDVRAAAGFSPDRVDVRIVGVRPAPAERAAGGQR